MLFEAVFKSAFLILAPQLNKVLNDESSLFEKIRNFTIEEQLEISQILNWNDRKIDIICTKKDNIKYSKVYTQLELDSLYIFRFQSIDYQINSQNIKIVDNKNESFFEFNFLNTKINWNEILLGKKNLKQLTSNFSAIEKKNLYKEELR